MQAPPRTLSELTAFLRQLRLIEDRPSWLRTTWFAVNPGHAVEGGTTAIHAAVEADNEDPGVLSALAEVCFTWPCMISIQNTCMSNFGRKYFEIKLTVN